ncbi:hypothetical protein [Paenibacillus xylanexedens]|uniref:hypothetical protein n=1 Tax=Paenibacillus xylanexedens TaxID=528191 RepID=UPI0011A0E40A|nr:hypothetical protein [Paenibacillus xylanexedens]
MNVDEAQMNLTMGLLRTDQVCAGYKEGRKNMPFIGGIILIIILAFILWALMIPLFNKIGSRILKKYDKFKQEENADEKFKDV